MSLPPRRRTSPAIRAAHVPRRGLILARSIALLIALTGAHAWALKDDDKQPMLIEADKVELDEATATSVYVGNVQVDQGTMRLSADHVTVYHHDDRRVKYIIALGQPATYKQLLDGDEGEVHAFAKRMDYDAVKDELVLIGDAVLIQGTDRISSQRIVYDRANERMRAGGSGRVKITITPESKDQQKAGSNGTGSARAGTKP